MTVDQDIYRRMSDADKAGFQARSPEGHAAKGMRIQGQEEVWIRIQADTFKNWVNVTLREDAVNASLNDNHYSGGTGNIMRGDEQPVSNSMYLMSIQKLLYFSPERMGDKQFQNIYRYLERKIARS